MTKSIYRVRCRSIHAAHAQTIMKLVNYAFQGTFCSFLLHAGVGKNT